MRLKQKTKNIIGGVLTAVVVISLITIYQVFVTHGELYQIKKIHIPSDKLYLKPLLGSHNIKEGENIFSFNASEVSELIENKLHYVRSVKIKKELPSDVYVDISHRIPILRLSEHQFYVTDDTGKVFMASKSNTSADIIENAPILIDEEASKLRPGDSLHSKAKLALNITTKFKSVIKPGFAITRIDTSNEIYLILHTSLNKQIFIPWEEIKEDEQISAAIELAVNAMIQGRENPFTKLIILVEQGRCHFTKL